MSEWSYVFFVGVKLLILSFFCICYVIGGRTQKWIRRYLGGIGFGLSIIGLSLWMGEFKWWLLALPVAYPAALTLGYGVNDPDGILYKFLFRGIYGLVFGLIGLYSGFVLGNLYLGIVQLGLPILVSIFLGVFNPTRAVDEEAMISLALVIHVPFML